MIVLFPFYIPIYLPRVVHNGILSVLRSLRIIPKRDRLARSTESQVTNSRFVRLRFHMGMITAPLIADLFLLAILAIGRQEVHVSLPSKSSLDSNTEHVTASPDTS